MAKYPYLTDASEVATTFDGYRFDSPTSWREYFKTTVRKDATKYNETGQITAADNFLQESVHTQSPLSGGRTAYNHYVGCGNVEVIKKGSIDSCAAVLAIPATYGNLPSTAESKSNEEYAWRPVAWHEFKVWYYILVVKGTMNKDRIRISYPPENAHPDIPGQCYFRFVTSGNYAQHDDGLIIEKPKVDLYNPKESPYYTSPREYGLAVSAGFYSMDVLYSTLSSADSGSASRREQAYDTSYGFIDAGKLAALKTYLSHWKEREPSSYSSIFWRYHPIGWMGSWLTEEKMSSIIISGFPIFTLENFDEMVKYFEGEEWESDNDPIPEDFSTDWDIYVKGAQRPDIYITMKSTKLDAWLESDSNKAGSTKDDIKVEYKYPFYEDPSLPYEEKAWLTDKYNVSRETSYEANARLNYANINTVLDNANEFSDSTISILIEGNYYAEMFFRLILDDEHRSAWCRYKIGPIGSPSVPDFSLMKNEGVQDDDLLEDSSTVTLHYDEVPDGFDPFPVPPTPPMPGLPNDDITLPTPVPPGQNGIGLLTTTYKITENTAKALGRFFWGGDLFEKIKALNTSPIENVVGLNIMPIDITGSPEVIVIGDVDTNLNGDVIETIPIYTLGSVEWKGRYQSFLDYEPYTSALIYLPFVGFVRINPAYFTNRTLTVKYSYDLICGLCNAMLFADGIFVESHQGHCGINVPLIATNRADLQIGLASSLLTTGASLATMSSISKKSAVGAGIGALNAVADYATGFHSERQSGYSPTCIWAETRQCYLVIESVNAAHSGTYNHDKGRPCIASATIGSLRGYTEIDAGVDLSGISGATEQEREMIRDILSSGFYA